MAKRAKTIDLLRVVDLLQEHITPALCRTVFGAVRKTERQRVWPLEAWIRFWTAVVLRAPKALSQALVDSLEGRDPTFPRIEASPEAFFQRCRDLRPAFFAEVFQRFTTRLVTAVPPRYAAEVAPVRARFTAIVILDGSRLAAIAHRLKLLWNERAVVLPGCLLGVYDLGRGLCRQLTFCADAAASEMTRAKAAVAALGPDTLILGDRLYGTADFFAAFAHQHCWGVVRRNRQLSLHKLQRLRKRRIHGGLLEGWLVRGGTGAPPPRHGPRHLPPAKFLPQGRHGHLSLPASATVGTRDSDAIPPPASPSRRRPPSLGPSGTGARAGRTPSRPPSHAPVLSRAPSLEVVRSCARWPTFHEIILAAMAFRHTRRSSLARARYRSCHSPPRRSLPSVALQIFGGDV